MVEISDLFTHFCRRSTREGVRNENNGHITTICVWSTVNGSLSRSWMTSPLLKNWATSSASAMWVLAHWEAGGWEAAIIAGPHSHQPISSEERLSQQHIFFFFFFYKIVLRSSETLGGIARKMCCVMLCSPFRFAGVDELSNPACFQS